MFKFNRPLAVGIYTASRTFQSQPRHVAVMFTDDNTLVACTGYADYSDKKAIDESFAYAQLFKTAPDMLAALEQTLSWLEHDGRGKSPLANNIRRVITRAKTVGCS